MTIDQRTLDKLRQFDSPTICNVIELFDVVPRNAGYMNGDIQCNFPDLPPMVGFASTASFRSAAPPAGGDAYGSFEEQVAGFSELPSPAIVVFQDLDDPPAAATFGEVMCTIYKGFGAAGLITSGGGRDLEQVENIEFPVFTGSTIVSHAYCHFMHVGQPVHIGGLAVHQGDLLHGDGNGVTRIPAEIANEISDVAQEFVDAEYIIMGYIRGSESNTVEGLAAARKEFSEVVAKLKERVQRS